MLVDPFELLGVSMHATPKEVRTRYYQLACICHPDRGGTAEQMRTLYNAYEFVMRSVALNTTHTLEDLQGAFDLFCKTQTQEPPQFRDIHDGEFQKAFETCDAKDVDAAFAPGGYETVPSEYTSMTPATPYTCDGAQALIEPFSSAMVVYTEPRALMQPSACVRDLTGTALESFTCVIGNQVVSDYREAFSPPEILQGINHVTQVTHITQPQCSVAEMYARECESRASRASVGSVGSVGSVSSVGISGTTK